MLYIFDEPSVGLHPRDVARINSIFTKLRDKGNYSFSLLSMIQCHQNCGLVIEVGPAAGVHGGEIMFEEVKEQLLQSDCLTGKHLSQMTAIMMNQDSRLTFIMEKFQASNNLLKISTLKFPKAFSHVLTV